MRLMACNLGMRPLGSETPASTCQMEAGKRCVPRVLHTVPSTLLHGCMEWSRWRILSLACLSSRLVCVKDQARRHATGDPTIVPTQTLTATNLSACARPRRTMLEHSSYPFSATATRRLVLYHRRTYTDTTRFQSARTFDTGSVTPLRF